MNEDRRPKVIEAKGSSSAKVSELVRYIAYGILAVVFTFLTSDSDFSAAFVKLNRSLLLFSGITALLAVVADYLQYLAAYLNAELSLQSHGATKGFLRESSARSIQHYAFFIKQAFALVSGIVLVSGFFRALF